jgi:hypothetical protein
VTTIQWPTFVGVGIGGAGVTAATDGGTDPACVAAGVLGPDGGAGDGDADVWQPKTRIATDAIAASERFI